MTVVPAPAVGDALAAATVYSGGVAFDTSADYRQAVVVVAGGGVQVRREFESGEPISVELYDAAGQPLPDGTYNWELELVPSAKIAKELRIAATQNGGAAPNAWRRQTGSFTIRNGLVASPDAAEPGEIAVETALRSSSRPGSAPPSFRRASPALDDDAAVGSRVGVEDELRAAAANAPALPAGALIQGDRVLFERTDAAAAAMGGSLEPTMPAMSSGEARPAPRSSSPDGKHGRPRSDGAGQ